MKRHLSSIHFLLLLNFVCFSSLSWAGHIVYPWRATTAIAKAGGNFEVWFAADAGQTVKSVQLKAAHHSVTTTQRVETGKWEYDVISRNTYNTKIHVTVPATAPADRYDVMLQTTSGTVLSPAAVKVIKEYKDTYYILHFSDMHAFQRRSEDALKRLNTIVDIANIINPEIIFNTGDNLHHPNEKHLDAMFIGNREKKIKALNDLNAATFSVVGNHDMETEYETEKNAFFEKSVSWNRWWGLQAYHFTYGNGRFMVLNNGWEGIVTKKQASEAQSWLKQQEPGNFRLGAVHIKNKELDDFDKLVQPDVILAGHNHHIADQNPFLLNGRARQYLVRALREYSEFNLYQVNNASGTFTPVGNATAQVPYVENPDDEENIAGAQPRLFLKFLRSNDGSHETNTATLVNNLDFPIKGARIRFLMPLGQRYTIATGQIEQSFAGTAVQVVDASLNLAPRSVTAVEILPTN
jgi:predicted MPP superfamily phosphohydrolase